MEEKIIKFEWGRGIWKNIDEVEKRLVSMKAKITSHPWGKDPYMKYTYDGPTVSVFGGWKTGFISGKIPEAFAPQSLPGIF